MDRFRDQHSVISSEVSKINSTLAIKSADRTIGNYFERMAFSVHKDVGSREHRFKLDDPRFLTEDFNTADA